MGLRRVLATERGTMKTHTVVIPLDGSRFAEAAVPAALKAAATLGASVTFVSAYDDEVLVAGYPLDAAGIRTSYEDYLEDIAARVQSSSQVEVHTAVITGGITKTLIEYVQRTQPVMVVMATHGRGPMTRFWLGSVADRMLRYVKMPVLLIRPSKAEDEQIDFSQAVDFKHILIPLDGSDRSEEGLEWARRIAGDDAEFVAFRGISIPTIATPYMPHTIQETEHALSADRDEAERYLGEVTERYAKEGLKLRGELMVGHSTASSILDATSEFDIDLTVITTHGRTGLARVLFGSVADKVIRGSSGPVLVVRTVHAAMDMDAALVEETRNDAVNV